MYTNQLANVLPHYQRDTERGGGEQGKGRGDTRSPHCHGGELAGDLAGTHLRRGPFYVGHIELAKMDLSVGKVQ